MTLDRSTTPVVHDHRRFGMHVQLLVWCTFFVCLDETITW